YLGIRIHRDKARRRLYLCLNVYIEKITAKFGVLGDYVPLTIPIPVTLLEKAPTSTATPREIKKY
ncbi:hypothetical protein QBC39DRAFT_270765, partial [Podospora conica]